MSISIPTKEEVKAIDFRQLLTNPDLIKQIGLKNVQNVLRLQKKLMRALDNPEFLINEYKINGKEWIGFMIREKER